MHELSYAALLLLVVKTVRDYKEIVLSEKEVNDLIKMGEDFVLKVTNENGLLIVTMSKRDEANKEINKDLLRNSIDLKELYN